MKFASLFLVFCFLGFVVVSIVHAQNFVITGNGADSNNSVLYDAGSNTVIHQTNSGDVTNTVHNSANTGGNSTDNGSVTTGNATSNVTITNNLNSNSAAVICCGTPSPKPTTVPGSPTVTPTPGTNNGGGDGEHNNSGGGGSGNGGSGGGQVLGLAGTSGEPYLEYLFYASSLICLVAAKKLLIIAS